jgi:hypothetical protein
MNLSVAIFLVNKSVRPVRVSYDPDYPKHNNPDAYFKTLDPSIKVGDKVVVPTTTRHGMTVCKVEEVDFRVNFDSTTDYKWVIGKVDVPAYEDIIAQELKVLDRIGDAEENRKRAELVKALQLEDINLTDLDITRGPTAIPAPPTPRGQPAAPSSGEPIEF